MDIVNLEDKVIPFMKRQNGPGESEGEWLRALTQLSTSYLTF